MLKSNLIYSLKGVLGLIMYNKINIISSVIAILSMFSLSVQAQNLNDIENQDAEASVMLESEEDAGACVAWLEETYEGEIQIGDNFKEDGTKFYVAIGEGDALAKTGHPNWINSRRNSYTRAMLDVKAKLTEEIGLDISRDIYSELAENSPLFSTAERKAKEAKSRTSDKKSGNRGASTKFEGGDVSRNDSRDASSAYFKVMELINRSLDKELKGTEPKKVSTDPKEAAEQVKEVILDVVSEEVFSDAITTAARAKLVGIRRLYTVDAAPLNDKGSVCVVALYSDTTQKIAEGMGMRDASLLPVGDPGLPLREMSPNPKTNEGIKELIATFGVDMMRDEDGDYVLLSYGQAGAKSKKKKHIKLAKKRAEKVAQAQLRTFLGELVETKGMMESVESVKELADNSELYESKEKLQEKIQSTSKTIKIQGMSRLYNWAGIHPATKQIVAGSVVYMSSKSLEGAQKRGADLKQAYERTEAGSKKTSRGNSSSGRGNEATQRNKYKRGAGRGTSKKNF